MVINFRGVAEDLNLRLGGDLKGNLHFNKKITLNLRK